MSDFDALHRWIWRSFAHFGPLWTQLPCGWPQSAHAQQVVSGGNDVGVDLHAFEAAHHRAAQSTVGLHPAEDLLDALSLSLADVVALMACRARIEPLPEASGSQGQSRRA